MKKTADTKTAFKFLDAYQMVRLEQQKSLIVSALEKALAEGTYAPYNMTSFNIKTSTFSAGLKSRSIDIAVLDPLPKRVLYAMIMNNDFNSSVDTNTYNLRYYMSVFSLYVNGKRLSSEGFTLDIYHEKSLLYSIEHSLKGPAYISRTRDYR